MQCRSHSWFRFRGRSGHNPQDSRFRGPRARMLETVAFPSGDCGELVTSRPTPHAHNIFGEGAGEAPEMYHVPPRFDSPGNGVGRAATAAFRASVHPDSPQAKAFRSVAEKWPICIDWAMKPDLSLGNFSRLEIAFLICDFRFPGKQGRSLEPNNRILLEKHKCPPNYPHRNSDRWPPGAPQ